MHGVLILLIISHSLSLTRCKNDVLMKAKQSLLKTLKVETVSARVAGMFGTVETCQRKIGAICIPSAHSMLT